MEVPCSWFWDSPIKIIEVDPMIHPYEEALNWIHSRLRLGITPGIVSMEWMIERRGNPERDMKVINVGGTQR